MSKAGRTRHVPVTLAGTAMAVNAKPVDRFPCGKLRPNRQRERNAFSPSMVQRAVLLAREKVLDPIFETPLGIMRLQGEVTDTHVAAAQEYARLRGRADRALGLKARSARSPSYEMGFSGGVGAISDLDTFEKANQRFSELRAILRKLVVREGGYRAGITMVDLIDNVCINGDTIKPAYFDALKAGLSECAIFFGMARKRI